MKKEDVPQDSSALGKVTKEVCYATDGSGKYTTALSEGWDVKVTALDTAWKDIEKRMAAAKMKVQNNEASPLLFYMEKGLMDVPILAGYTGFWKWQIRLHLTPAGFRRLSDKQLERYAKVFDITAAELKNMTGHDQ